MANTIAQKLRIQEKDILLALSPPPEFKKNIGVLPAGVKIINSGKEYNQVHWFVMNKAQMIMKMKKVLALLKEEVICWIYYPKGTSKLQTDLTRDKGWEDLLAHGDKLTWISLISFDETWSVFGFRLKTEADRKKEAKPKEVREIFKYVDPKTKEVRLPEDMAGILKKNKKEAGLFDALSFTNKKEYIEWVVTAKREETRKERLNGTIERLGKGWKNPANR
jgi:hypothetical protein